MGPFLGKGNVCGDREEGLVIDLALYPVHQEGDVVWCGQMGRLLVLGSVLQGGTVSENVDLLI
jgi:hypothetical protein